ncbi:MAG: UDP-N-acetylmuramate dehydrogenase [bacterium]|nr:UDP-N-acetylmuramate dehydrogenase [bacterium]
MDYLYNELQKYGQVHARANLAKNATFHIGGEARFLIDVTETDKFVGLLNYLLGEGIDWMILGSGTNVLFNDEPFDGVVIKVLTKKVTANGNEVEAEAGALLSNVMSVAMKAGLTGLEWTMGVPGTIGGAVRGNAGAMGRDIASSITKVEAWQDGEVKYFTRPECKFVYRGSIFKDKEKKLVILRMWLLLIPGDRAASLADMKKYMMQRQGRYPVEPSAGSFFKNIKMEQWKGNKDLLPPLFLERGSIPVGWLVERCNMKGYAVGGAKISDIHGNFLINFNNATQKDVLAVVEKVKQAVYDKFGITLEPEVEIIKN